MDKDFIDQTNLQRAVYRFIADPQNDEKGARVIRHMRANPPVTAQTLPALSAKDQAALQAAIAGFWKRGNHL